LNTQNRPDVSALAAEQHADEIAKAQYEYGRLRHAARIAVTTARDEGMFCDKENCEQPVCVAWARLERTVEAIDGPI
jgi:hypothetical protein